MAYIQLSLYGIPAVVYCGDALSQKMRFKLETPSYFLQYWKFRKFYMQNDEDTEEQPQKETKQIIIKEENKNYKEVTVKGNCQISLW